MEPIVLKGPRTAAKSLVLVVLVLALMVAVAGPQAVAGDLSPSPAEDVASFSLPEGSVVHLRFGDLFKQVDGQPLERLTFTRGRISAAALLPDGRILYLLSGRQGGRLFSVLPDGTWATLWPTPGRVDIRDFAILQDDLLLVLDGHGDLWELSIADPYATARKAPIDGEGILGAVVSGDDIEISGTSRSALQAAELPSIVKAEKETGFLFVIDVARTDDPELNGLDRSKIGQLDVYQLTGTNSRFLLSSVRPENDGSVYLEAPADTSLVLELVDRHGRPIAATETPIWVRPNERRGCIGCHVSPAYAPPNIRPVALTLEPHRLRRVAEEVSP